MLIALNTNKALPTDNNQAHKAEINIRFFGYYNTESNTENVL